MRRFAAFLFLLLPFAACAASRITATITVTNAPSTNGMQIIFNGSDTRTFSNSQSATLILTNGTVGGTATNINLHLSATPFTLTTMQSMPATNQIRFTGGIGQAVAITFAGSNIATATYSTQTVSSAQVVRVPLAVEVATNQVGIASQLTLDLSTLSTNPIGRDSVMGSNFMTLTSTQIVSGPKQFTGTNTFTNSHWGGGTNLNTRTEGGLITNQLWNKFSGTNTVGTEIVSNLYALNFARLNNATLTNGTNKGLPFESLLTNATEVIFGRFANTYSGNSVTIGHAATNVASGGIVIGTSAYGAGGSIVIGKSSAGYSTEGFVMGTLATITNGDYSVTIGYQSSILDSTNSFAIGPYAKSTTGSQGGAIGYSASNLFLNSLAIGSSVGTTETNQIRMGDTTYIASFPGAAAFANSLIVGTASRFTPPASFAGGIILTNGTSATADPANGVAFNAASGQWQYRASASGEGSGAINRVHNRGAETNASGANAALPNATAVTDFGGTEAAITLPSAGTYLVTVLTAVTGATAADVIHAKIRNSTAAADIANSATSIAVANTGAHQIVLTSVLTVTSGDLLELWAHNATAARGELVATSTKILYVRLY